MGARPLHRSFRRSGAMSLAAHRVGGRSASPRWSIPLTPDGPVGPWLRVGAAKPRRPVGLASLRSEPERDGGGVADEHDGTESAEERQRRLAPLRRATCVAPRAEGPERKLKKSLAVRRRRASGTQKSGPERKTKRERPRPVAIRLPLSWLRQWPCSVRWRQTARRFACLAREVRWS